MLGEPTREAMSTGISHTWEILRRKSKLPFVDGIFTDKKVGRKAGRILVVDDDETIRDVTASALLLAGFEVSTACDGEEAVEMFHQEIFDLVLSDQIMSRMDGWALADYIKERSPGTAVGIMTGWDREESRARMKKHSIDFLIFKPFHISDLYSTINHALEVRIPNTALHSNRERGDEEEATEAYILVRRGADDEVNKVICLKATWYKTAPSSSWREYMSSNFKVLVHRDSRTLHLKLVGDFESSSIAIVVNVIRKFSFGAKNIFVHTSGVNNVRRFDHNEFKHNLSVAARSSARLVFTGELAAKIAPWGPILVC